MKVYIGPYKSWFGPYQLAEKLMFWVPKDRDEYGFEHNSDRVHRFGEWLAHGSIAPELKVGDPSKWIEDRPKTWLYRFLEWIDSKRERTVSVQIDRYDTWGMCETLALITLPMLKQLKASKQGSPFIDDEDVPEHLRSTSAPPKENEGDTDDNHHARWDWVLDEMIFAFEHKVDTSWEDEFYTGTHDFSFVKQEDGNFQMVRGPNDTAHWDKEGHDIIQARITNGFRLFGRYYESLWD